MSTIFTLSIREMTRVHLLLAHAHLDLARVKLPRTINIRPGTLLAYDTPVLSGSAQMHASSSYSAFDSRNATLFKIQRTKRVYLRV